MRRRSFIEEYEKPEKKEEVAKKEEKALEKKEEVAKKEEKASEGKKEAPREKAPEELTEEDRTKA